MCVTRVSVSHQRKEIRNTKNLKPLTDFFFCPGVLIGGDLVVTFSVFGVDGGKWRWADTSCVDCDR